MINKENTLIFIDPKKRNFYCEGKNVCSKCGKKLFVKDAFFLVSEYSTSINRHLVLCLDCIKKHKPLGVICERKLVFIISKLPETAIPVLLTPPRLKSFSGETVFTAPYIDTPITKDKTTLMNNGLIDLKDKKKLKIEKK